MGKSKVEVKILGDWWWISLGVVGLMLMGWSVWQGRKKEEVKGE